MLGAGPQVCAVPGPEAPGSGLQAVEGPGSPWRGPRSSSPALTVPRPGAEWARSTGEPHHGGFHRVRSSPRPRAVPGRAQAAYPWLILNAPSLLPPRLRGPTSHQWDQEHSAHLPRALNEWSSSRRAVSFLGGKGAPGARAYLKVGLSSEGAKGTGYWETTNKSLVSALVPF